MSQSITDEFVAKLCNAVSDGVVLENIPMSTLTTFKIGGPARVVVDVASIVDVLGVVDACRDAGVEYRVIGCGSNILVADSGIDCVILRFGDSFSDVNIEGEHLFAQAGATNEKISKAAQKAGLAGYEFASGIPGSVGGAAYMNAGAYDGEFADVAVSVTCLDAKGQLVELDCEQACFSYRHSAMMDENLIVLGATLKLNKDDPAAIQARMDDLRQRREEKQPLEMPSAGSTFKRPEGYYAGKLIQDAGLKGYSVGGAMVSAKHSGFVVNAGGATAADVCQLIGDIQDKVYSEQGVRMEPEVRMWGFGE